MFYYAGLAFDRATSSTSASSVSAIFVARYDDLNNNENTDPITYIDTHVVASGNSTQFLDKPALAVDIPRSGASTCSFTANEPKVGANGGSLSVHQSFAAGNVYLAYTDFLQATKSNSTPTHLMVTHSTDCGVTWNTPVQVNTGTTTSQGSAIAINPVNGNVYVVWRQFASTGISNAIMIAQSTNAGKTFSAPVQISTFTPFDQGTTGTAIRTNAYPSITTDNFGFVYVSFSAKGLSASGDARVVATGSIDGTHWLSPIMVDNPSTNAQTDPSGRGHQIMPAITFANGRLTILYYDLRLDHYQNNYTSSPSSPTGYTSVLTPEGELAPPASPSKVFTPYLDDAGLTLRRHTIDLRVLELGIFPTVTLGPSVLISQYAYGCCVNPNLPDIEQYKFNVPNLPLFDSGQEPFLGDYIDVVPSPAFLPSGTSWVYNFTPSVNPQFHATWTDNRDVVPPANGNWEDYTPAVPINTKSVFDPGATLPNCQIGQEGMRNQNIYTAQITGGLVAGAPGNFKPLGTTVFNGKTVPFQRAFAVEAQNVTSASLNVRFSIANQPTGGTASFLQFSQLTTLDVTVPAFSSVSRSVFVTSTNADATVTVNVIQINSIGGSQTTNGLSSATVLNPDVTNPNITNPNVTNPNITNPNITNFEVTNPNVTNPNITNPNVTNPNITNPNITNPNVTNPNITNPNVTNVSATNPNITNPNITNPDVTNPNITNPNITNPNVTNGSIQDVIYPLTNNGNTIATYDVKVAESATPPNGVLLQLILNKLYQTPTAIQCQLTTETHWVTVANIINPKLYAPTDPLLGNPNITNSTPNEATVTLAPGETAYIDFRVFSPTKTPINPLLYFVPVTIPHAVNTTTALSNPGTTTLPPVTVPPLIITNAALPDDVSTHAYSATVGVQGGNPSPSHTFSVSSGALPGGLILNPTTGTITGTPTVTGTYTFSIQVKDAAIGTQFPQHTTTQAFTIHVVAPLVLAGGALPGATQGTSYSNTIVPTGGLAPVTLTLASGSVPAGLNFNDGAITGIPTGTGLANFTVKATDSSNPPQVTTQPYSINVVAAGPNIGSVTFVAQPANSTGGQVISGSPVTVQVFDNTHAVVPNVMVTMAFNGTPPCSAAVLSGTLTQTTGPTGVATFPDLSIDRGQLGYTLQAFVASAPTVKGVSNAFTVNGFCPTGSLSVARDLLTSTLLQNGNALVAGGQNSASAPTNNADVYNPSTGAFTATTGLLSPRYSHTATLLNNGTVLIVGGRNTAGWVATAEIYNPANGTFTNTTHNPVSPRSQHTATLLADGTVLIAGGFYNSATLNTAEIYNPSSQTFTSVGPMNEARINHTGTLLANGKVLIATGQDASAEIYDPVAQTFTVTGSLNTSRQNPSATLLSNGKVLIAGGLISSTTGINTAELYDPVAGTFSYTGNLNHARGYHTATLLTDGTVMVAGGFDVSVSPDILITAEIYNPVAGTFSNTGSMSQNRWESTASILNDGTVLTAGGFGGNSPQSSAERFYSTSTLAPLTLTTPGSTVTLVESKLNYQFLQEQGGVGPLTWSLQSGPGSLPAGTQFNSTNGLISGTPTVTGSFPLTVTITDSSSPAKSTVTHPSVNVIAPLAITTTTLPNGTVGVPYSAPINTSGGTPPIAFSFTTANFPPGLTITQPPTGTTSDTLTGTPTTQGTYNFSESVTDSGNPAQTSTQSYSVTINAAAPPPAVMMFTSQPGNETTNQNIPQFVVNLQQGGAPVVGASVSLGFGNAACSSATLSGTTSVQTDNNGNATFSQAFVDRGSPGYTLTATSTAPAATATSNAFNVPGFCATTPLTAPLDGQVGVLFPNGQVLMVGGYNTVSNAYVLPGEIYTPGSGFANTTGSLHIGRTNYTATLLTTGPNAGSVLIVGGVIDNNDDGTATTELFNPSTAMFTLGPSMSVARYYHTATMLPNGDVLIAGGASSAQANAYLNTAEIYHASTGQFSAPINMTAVHAEPTATLLPNGQVLIAGGFVWIPSGGGFISVATGVAELFDPSSNTFTATASLNTARAEDIAVLLPNGTVLVAAGTNSSNTLEGSAEIYNPGTGAFTYTGSMTPTINSSAALLPSGKVLVAGGFNNPNPQTSQAQLYDPSAGTFTIISPMVSAREYFPLTVLNNGTVLVPGGYGTGGGSLALSELYFPDPSSGIQVTTPSPLPTALTNSPYTQFLEEQGGVGPLSWSSPNLPEGMSLSQSGVLSGSPVPPAGSTNLTVQVSDSSVPPQSTSAVLVFNVAAPIQITTTTLPDAPTQNGAPPGTSNVGYSQQVLTTGGAGGATTFSVISGALPSSMSLNTATGVISSSNVTDAPQTFNFTIQAVSAGPPSSTTSQALSIRIVPLFYGDTSNTLPSGTVGTSYSTPIASGGGISPYTYSFAYGSLPPGLNVISTGAVTGTPTAASTYMFTVSASDSSNPPQVYYEQFTITIAPAAQVIAHLSFTSQPTQTIDDSPVNGTSSPSVQVLATDASSMPVANATLTIGYGTKPCSSAMLEVSPPPTAVTDATGTATFSSLRTYTSGDNGYTLTVTSSNNISVTSNTFNVTGYCTAATPIAAHSGGATIALPNGMVLITGGQDSTSGAPIVKTAELYNPTNGTFALTGPMQVARTNHRATLLNDGTVLITGGISATSPSTVYESSAEIYSPTNGTFTLVAPPMSTMGVARAAHTATLLPSGNVLIAGGQNSSGNLKETELYQPGNGFLVNDGLLTSPRTNATATLVSVGGAPMVLIAGGYGATDTAPGLNTAELYDPSVGSFTLTAGTMTAGHVGHTATLLNNSTVLIVGGEASGGGGSAIAEIFSPSSQTFTATTGPLNVGRSFHSAALLSNGKVLFSGGWTNFGNASTNQAEIYDPTASTFSDQGLLAYSRSLAGIALLPSGQVLIVGGIESGSIGSVPAEVYNPGP
jgi:hypothetical protein